MAAWPVVTALFLNRPSVLLRPHGARPPSDRPLCVLADCDCAAHLPNFWSTPWSFGVAWRSSSWSSSCTRHTCKTGADRAQFHVERRHTVAVVTLPHRFFDRTSPERGSIGSALQNVEHVVQVFAFP